MERNYQLEVGDVVLVAFGGWGLDSSNIEKYVELTGYDERRERWFVKGYDCDLLNHESDYTIDARSFGNNPLILLNTKEEVADNFIGKEFQVEGEGYIYKIHDHDEDHYFVGLSNSEISSEGQTHRKKMVETRINEGVWVLVDRKVSVQAVTTEQYTGSSSNYYKVYVKHPTTLPDPYEAECNDIIESLQMTFAEGNAFKAIWRKARARQGVKKKGYDNGVYDSEKVVFFGERMLIEARDNG